MRDARRTFLAEIRKDDLDRKFWERRLKVMNKLNNADDIVDRQNDTRNVGSSMTSSIACSIKLTKTYMYMRVLRPTIEVYLLAS